MVLAVAHATWPGLLNQKRLNAISSYIDPHILHDLLRLVFASLPDKKSPHNPHQLW